MVSITQSYRELKSRYGAVMAREMLLECLEQQGRNISETAREMRCNRRTIMKALEKQTQGDLKDLPHTPHTQPNKTSDEVEAKVVEWRIKTKCGRRRLKKILKDEEGVLLTVSTIGKILKRNKVKIRSPPISVDHD